MSTTASKMQEPHDVKCQTSTRSLCRVKFVQQGKILNWHKHLVMWFNSEEISIGNTQVRCKWTWTFSPSIRPVPWLLTCPGATPGPGVCGHREKSSCHAPQGLPCGGRAELLTHTQPTRGLYLPARKDCRRKSQEDPLGCREGNLFRVTIYGNVTFPSKLSQDCCPRQI